MKSDRAGKWILFLAALPAAPAAAATAVYATSPPAFHIDVKPASGTALSPLLSPVNPWGLACDPETGRIYFSDPTGGRIGSFDPAVAPPTVTTLINRPAAAFHGIALDSPNRRLFFLDSANDSVNVIRLDTLAQETIVSGEGIRRPNDLTWDAARGWLWFTDSGNDFIGLIRSWGGGAFNGQAFSATNPWGIAVHPRNGTVYYTSYTGGTVHTLDPVTGTPAVAATGLNGPRGLRFDAYGRLFCLESGLNRIVQVPLPGQAVTTPAYTQAENGRAFLIFESDDLDGDHLTDAWERRFRPTLAGLSSASDPDQDGRSALEELMFNGSPNSGADPAPVRSFSVSGGTVIATFQGPRDGYDFGALLSSDLSSWQNYTESLTQVNLADPLFATWTLKFTPAALGLNPARTFIRFTGDRKTP